MCYRKILKVLGPILILVGVGVFAGWPLLRPGFIPTHDGEFHIIRFWQFDKELRSGNLFPRWAPDLNSGYGVPLFNFYYPFPNYIGFLFHTVGYSYPDSLKMSLMTAYSVAIIFCFLWLKKLFGPKAAIFGTIVFSFVPYWFVDIYVRGDIGEVTGLAFLMITLWSIESKLGIGISIAFAGIIISHNLSALIFLPFLILYCLIRRNYKVFVWILLGIGLASYFWIPALFEQKFIAGLNNFDYRENFPMLAELLIPSWGTGFSGPDFAANKMSPQIGVAVLLLLPSVFWTVFKERDKSYRRLIWVNMITFWSIFFLMLKVSQPVWDFFRPIQILQFPWRLLTLVIPVSALFAGYLGWKIKQNYLLIIFGLLPVVSAWSYARPVLYQPRSDDYYLSRKNFTDGTANVANNFSTLWLPWQSQRAKSKVEVLEGNIQILNLSLGLNSYHFAISSASKGVLRINTAYYPGWVVRVDFKHVPVDYKKNGVITFAVPSGEHTVRVDFTETPLRYLADIISILSLFCLLGLGILGQDRYAYRFRNIFSPKRT